MIKFNQYSELVQFVHTSFYALLHQVCLRGACLYLDGQNKIHNNWMAFIECANFEEEQNLEAFQSYGEIYFRTTKAVDPGTELKVFYSEEYARHVSFKLKLKELQTVFDKGTGRLPRARPHF